jgi:hypothetical protein
MVKKVMKKPFLIYISEDIAGKVLAFCKILGMSRSVIIEKLLIQWLKDTLPSVERELLILTKDNNDDSGSIQDWVRRDHVIWQANDSVNRDSGEERTEDTPVQALRDSDELNGWIEQGPWEGVIEPEWHQDGLQGVEGEAVSEDKESHEPAQEGSDGEPGVILP